MPLCLFAMLCSVRSTQFFPAVRFPHDCLFGGLVRVFPSVNLGSSCLAPSAPRPRLRDACVMPRLAAVGRQDRMLRLERLECLRKSGLCCPRCYGLSVVCGESGLRTRRTQALLSALLVSVRRSLFQHFLRRAADWYCSTLSKGVFGVPEPPDIRPPTPLVCESPVFMRVGGRLSAPTQPSSAGSWRL